MIKPFASILLSCVTAFEISDAIDAIENSLYPTTTAVGFGDVTCAPSNYDMTAAPSSTKTYND
jgi:hypothetical protein